MNHPLHFLVVDDDAAVGPATGRLLEQAGYVVQLARSCAEAERALATSRPHLILLDRQLPDGDGLELCRRIKAAPAGEEIFVLIATAVRVAREDTLEGLESGADGYLLRPLEPHELLVRVEAFARLARMRFRLQEEIAKREALEAQLEQRVRERTAGLEEANRKLAEARRAAVNLLQDATEAQHRFEQVFHHHPVPMALTDFEDRRFCEVNRAFTEVTGFDREEALGRTAVGVGLIVDPAAHAELGARLRAGSRVTDSEMQIRRKDGRVLDGLFSGALIQQGGRCYVLSVMVDITERKRHEAEKTKLQAQFLQAQKMDAIGRLAGGVAHDFNNMLAATMLQLSLLANHPELSGSARQAIQELEVEATRAANLTRQLLMFSRRAVLQMRPLYLNEVVENLLKMLRRVIGENYSLEFVSQPGLPLVVADVGMVEQVVLNLAVNARDAMPAGGTVQLGTLAATWTSEQCVGHPRRRPGRFVCIEVKDTGCGIPEAQQAMIFEPFFTTKEAGKGTGLGLSTVDGIVNQHEGWVEFDSAVGRGSAFRVYFPVQAAPAPAEGAVPAAGPLQRGTEKILLVEDERVLRTVTKRNLVQLGYQVIEAQSAAQALDLWREHQNTIDILLTDMVMPGGMSGYDLMRRLRVDRPELPVVLMSGYSAELPKLENALNHDLEYIAKPFGLGTLTRSLRRCLDRTPAE